MLDTEAKNVVDFVGQDGSLGVMDPSKTRLDGRKVFQFNQVYGPTATQGKLHGFCTASISIGVGMSMNLVGNGWIWL